MSYVIIPYCCHVSSGSYLFAYKFELIYCLKLVVTVVLQFITVMPKPGTMAAENMICSPKPLEDGDAKSWFKQFIACTAAKEWNTAKMLMPLLPMLLRG